MTLLGRERWIEWKSMPCTKEFLQDIKDLMNENDAALGRGNFFDMDSVGKTALGGAKGTGTSQAYQGILDHVDELTKQPEGLREEGL